jgi:hypothetical protein
MHALIDADYKRLKRQISRDIISFMQAHHDSPDAYLVDFDYTVRNGVKATVQAQPAVPELFASYRNRRLHVVFVAFGLGRRHSTFFLCERAARLSMPDCIALRPPRRMNRG